MLLPHHLRHSFPADRVCNSQYSQPTLDCREAWVLPTLDWQYLSRWNHHSRSYCWTSGITHTIPQTLVYRRKNPHQQIECRDIMPKLGLSYTTLDLHCHEPKALQRVLGERPILHTTCEEVTGHRDVSGTPLTASLLRHSPRLVLYPFC